MKKFLFTFICLAAAVSMYAQTAIGVKGGFQMAKFTDKVYNDIQPGSYSIGLGLQGGGILNFGYNKLISLQLELNLSNKKSPFEADDGNDKFDYILNYVEIPILLKGTLGGEKLKFYGIFGPYAAFPFKEIYKYKEKADPTFNPFKEKDWSYFDLGVKIGGGILYNLGPVIIFVDLRYSMGLAQTIMDNYYNSGGLEASGGLLLPLSR